MSRTFVIPATPKPGVMRAELLHQCRLQSLGELDQRLALHWLGCLRQCG
jgi:hypothetical protein